MGMRGKGKRGRWGEICCRHRQLNHEGWVGNGGNRKHQKRGKMGKRGRGKTCCIHRQLNHEDWV